MSESRRDRSTGALIMMASGTSLGESLQVFGPNTRIGDRPFDRPILNLLIEHAAPDQHQRIATLALEAMKRGPTRRRVLHYPFGLITTALIALAVNVFLSIVVAPVFDVFVTPGGTVLNSEWHFRSAAVLTFIAIALGVVGMMLAEGPPRLRYLAAVAVLVVIPPLWPILVALAVLLGIRRRRPRRIDATLRWSAAGAAAGVRPLDVIKALPRPMTFDRRLRRLRRAALQGGAHEDVIKAWAGPDAPNLAAAATALADEDIADVYRRLAQLVRQEQRSVEIGTMVSVAGYACLVAAAYLVVAPTMIATFELAGGL